MNKTLLWRFAFTGVVLAVALYAALPLSKKIHLGLDLQGGMHLVYEVQSEKALEMSLNRIMDEVSAQFDEKGITPADLHLDDELRLRMTLDQESDVIKAKRIIADVGSMKMVTDLSDGRTLVYAMSEPRAKVIKENAVDQALETLRNRIDQFGVSEPTIQRQGSRRILLQLPGISDPQRAKSLIQTTARLEFKLVDDGATSAFDEENPGELPSYLELLYKHERDPLTGRLSSGIPYILEKKILLGGESITDADVRIDQQYNEPYVMLTFDSEGGKRFADITGKNVKRRLAIVLDGKVHSAPVIQERIGGGSASITGGFSPEEAHDLAITLRAGALPAPLIMLEERTVGPSLGADSVARGVKSIMYGFIIVVLFMLVYYRVGGLIADFALLLNLVILAGAMGYFQATLTLPGIAGIILTVGMAVDANVLIFERIREEVLNGKTIRAAVDAGFDKAFLTIIDANVTTLIAAIVLFQFGTGPIKGFAVTLTIGVLASMFTAIFVSRTFFYLILANRRTTRINL